MLWRTAVLYFISLINRIFILDFCLILRDIYYSDVPFFGNQGVVDSIVDNLACMLRVPRFCLHVVSFSQLKAIPQLYRAFFFVSLSDVSLFASSLHNNFLSNAKLVPFENCGKNCLALQEREREPIVFSV